MLQDSKKQIVSLNKLVKLRFEDGTEHNIRIIEKKSKFHEVIYSNELPVDSKTPISLAILGHRMGEKIEFKNGGNSKQITILEIY